MLVDVFRGLIGLGLPALGLFLVLLLFGVDEAGYRLGRRRVGVRPAERDTPGVSMITTGMLGLLAFTLGLSISMAQGRFDTRRTLVLEEAKAIDSAWSRAGLVGGPEGPAIRAMVEEYARVRLAFTTAPRGDRAREVRLDAETTALVARMQAELERLAARAPTPLTVSLATALNHMSDMAMAQRFAFESRVPIEILWMLLGGAMLAIGAMGFQFGLAGHRLPLMTALLIGMWVIGMLLIIDLSRPRDGSILVDPRPLEWLLEGFATARPASAPD
jgi:hypothetical protein